MSYFAEDIVYIIIQGNRQHGCDLHLFSHMHDCFGFIKKILRRFLPPALLSLHMLAARLSIAIIFEQRKCVDM